MIVMTPSCSEVGQKLRIARLVSTIRSRPGRAVPLPPVALTIGIVGLPNVGKSTLFNALTKNDVLAANYPFATIEPNIGVVGVPDSRLAVLAGIFSSEKVVPATVSFVDIAGIVRGASEGEGLVGQLRLGQVERVDERLGRQQ